MTREEWNALTPDEQWEKFVECGTAAFDAIVGWGKTITSFYAVDVNENPSLPGMIGDLTVPVFEDGSWWVSDYNLRKHREAKNGQSR